MRAATTRQNLLGLRPHPRDRRLRRLLPRLCRMIAKYQHVQSANKSSPEEAANLSQERNEHRRLRNRLVDKFSEAIEPGQGFSGVLLTTRRTSAIAGRDLPQPLRADRARPLPEAGDGDGEAERRRSG